MAQTLGRLQHGRLDPVHRVSDLVAWRTVRTPDGRTATLRVQAAGGALLAEAWGAAAESAVADAPDLLGGRDDPTGFVPGHPVLERAHRRFPGLRIARTGDVLGALVGATLEQRVTGEEAVRAWQVLHRALGDPAPGPAPAGMVTPPSPRAWQAAPEALWRRAGVDGRRVATVRTTASRADALARLLDRDAASAGEALRSLPGVGAWTAAEVRQRAFGDADAVSVGDFHLAAVVGHVLAGRRFTDAELVPFLEPWRPHRYRVARLLYASGWETAPPTAPKRPRSPRP
ncbi:3-methyladenine DNA glycosylase [Curtobacterium sp. 'Ferrero']|nr:3-methyladenine DNA glycosylase [Curtobacterium sp. 'Ferrero']